MIYKYLAALVLSMSMCFPVFSAWELYDDFNDSYLDPEKWDILGNNGVMSESSGYLRFLGSTTDTVSIALRSKLPRNDVIKGLRMYIYLTESCDFSGTISVDSMLTGMITRGLTNPVGGFSNDYVFAQTYLRIDNTVENFESNYVETH